MRTLRAALLLLLAVCFYAGTKAQNQSGSSDNVFTIVEEMPRFTGGEDSLLRFIKANLEYPQKEREDSVQGKVVVSFVLDEEGRVTNPVVKRGVSPGLDAEAVRVVLLLPKFIPGKQQGKAVKVAYTIPIVFKLAYKTTLTLPSTIEMVVLNGSNNLADYKPGLPGGETAFAAMLIKNLVYPKKEREEYIEGKATVTCDVKADGTINSVAITKSSGNTVLDNEALRVVRLAPKFDTTYMKGQAIAVTYNIPISFIIQGMYKVPLLNPATAMHAAESSNNKPKYVVENGDTIYPFADIPAKYEGGWEGIPEMLQKLIVYPASEKNAGTEGKVMVRFVVDKQGAVTKPVVVRGVSPALDAEALRVVGLLAPFKAPGKLKDGTPVNSYFNLPIVFQLR